MAVCQSRRIELYGATVKSHRINSSEKSVQLALNARRQARLEAAYFGQTIAKFRKIELYARQSRLVG